MKRTLSASWGMVAMTVILFFVPPVQSFAQAGTWTTKTPMPTPRIYLGAGEVNGIIYAVGGYNGNSGVLATVEAYDTASNSWVSKTPMPTPRAYESVSVVNGVLYVVGGDYQGILGTVLAYNPVSDSWTSKAYMPTARYLLSTSVVNGVIYAIGGTFDTTVPGSALGTVEAYDPVSDTWTTKASMPTARYGLETGVVNGVIYAVGGFNGSNNDVGTVEAYDPASDTWTTKSSMPTARHTPGMGVVNGVIYAVGGNNGATIYGTVEAYDPASDTWTPKASMTTPRSALGASVVNGIIYAIGGGDSSSILATNEAYTPAPALVGDGSAITNLTAANISAGTAGINITGNAATATTASTANSLTCTGCVGNTQLGVNYAGSASQGGPATSALIAGLANAATNALALGGIPAANFARLDVGNLFNGNQTVTGNVATSGSMTIGTGGTPILEHLSLTFNPAFAAVSPHSCISANFTFAGASDGDTIALGVPNSRMLGGGTLEYATWVASANTITIRACNINMVIKQTIAGSGAIRVDIWKH